MIMNDENISNTTAIQEMLYRNLGSTGEKVSVIGIGGAHIGHKGVVEQLSIRIIRSAIDRGPRYEKHGSRDFVEFAHGNSH